MLKKKQAKHKVTFKTVIVIEFDPHDDAEWAMEINKELTKNKFELVDWEPGVATYERPGEMNICLKGSR